MNDIEVDIDNAIAVVTLNRPDQRNAITYAMWQELAAVFGGLERAPHVRAIILKGAGDDFSTGADVSEFDVVRAGRDGSKRYEVAVDAAADAIFNVSKPTIAALRGCCLGGAAHLAMCCDFRIATPEAMFGVPAARLSIVYGVSATSKLFSLVGAAQAKRILYTGTRFAAHQALAIGFIDQIAADPVCHARLWAQELTDSAPLTIKGAKFILNGCTRGALDRDAAEALVDDASASRDYVEGRLAFRERRAPSFVGR